MQCKHARELVSAFVDGEIVDDRQHAVEMHVASCPVCKVLADDYRRIGHQLGVSYEPAPAGLVEKIRAGLSEAAAEAAPQIGRPDWRQWVRQAAVLFLATGL